MQNQISTLSLNINSLFEQVKDPSQIQADARQLYGILQANPELCLFQKDYYCFSKALFFSYIALLEEITSKKNYERFVSMVYYALIQYIVSEKTESEEPKERLLTEILAYCFCFLYRKECFNMVAGLTMNFYIPSAAARQVMGFMVFLYWKSKSVLIEEKQPSVFDKVFGKAKKQTDKSSFAISPILRPIYEANVNKHKNAIQESLEEEQLSKLSDHFKNDFLKDHLRVIEDMIISWQEMMDINREMDVDLMCRHSMDY